MKPHTFPSRHTVIAIAWALSVFLCVPSLAESQRTGQKEARLAEESAATLTIRARAKYWAVLDSLMRIYRTKSKPDLKEQKSILKDIGAALESALYAYYMVGEQARLVRSNCELRMTVAAQIQPISRRSFPESVVSLLRTNIIPGEFPFGPPGAPYQVIRIHSDPPAEFDPGAVYYRRLTDDGQRSLLLVYGPSLESGDEVPGSVSATALAAGLRIETGGVVFSAILSGPGLSEYLSDIVPGSRRAQDIAGGVRVLDETTGIALEVRGTGVETTVTTDGEQVILLPSGVPVEAIPQMVDDKAPQIEWVYLYFGDGHGAWARVGRPLHHTFARRWHYDLVVVLKADGGLFYSAFYVAEVWQPADVSTPPSEPPEFSAPVTGNSELDAFLRSLPKRQ
jgi:hypothetical protein